MTDATQVHKLSGLWARLRRRKVVQWGLTYFAGAWALLQGIDFLVNAFHWPDTAKQIATIGCAVGLPIALILAWYHGDRGQQRVGGTELALLVSVLGLGGVLLWRYEATVEEPATAAITTAAKPVPERAPPSLKSIAVLPFVDMSPQKDQAYMADGLAEEILNLLAKAPDLRVVARTSSFSYKGKDAKIADIARDLNVAHVLEGSVRTSGDRIRVTAQLIHASDDIHVWSETFDRKLVEIFQVQDEIAGAIAQALQIKIAGGHLTRREGGTQDLEAYQLYLRANRAADENTRASVESAEKDLERAIELDPGFARAWQLLGSNYIGKADLGMIGTAEGIENARTRLQHALALSPDLPDAHADLAYISLTYDWDFGAAEAGIRRTLELDPTGVMGLAYAGRLYAALGRWSDAEQRLHHALDVDPLNPWPLMALGISYYLEGRYKDSEAIYRRLLAQEPGFAWTRIYLAKTLLALGDPVAALDMVRQESDESIRLLYLPIMLHAAGEHAEAEQALQAQIKEWEDSSPYFVAQSYAYRGDVDAALQWLERAYRKKDASLVEMTGEPLLNNIAYDSRFKSFLRKMRLPDVWTARLDKTVPVS